MVRVIDLHATSQQGRRESNEDVELFQLNLSEEGFPENEQFGAIDFFIICDGHGGIEVANFVAPRLKRYFLKKSMNYPLTHGYICKIYDYIQKELDNHPQQIGLECGCTALIVIRYISAYNKEYIQVINLGDCRAVLSRRGLAIPLCKDHKPFWSDEKQRIDFVNKKYNTDVKIHFDAGDWRVHELSVCRSFGDINATPQVTHIPESFIYPLKNDDEFIIIACDGLWDILQNHEAVNFVRDHMNDNNISFYEIEERYPSEEVRSTNCIARKLASYAIARGSSDNVSIFIIFFGKSK
jgi:protein phosphatase 2C